MLQAETCCLWVKRLEDSTPKRSDLDLVNMCLQKASLILQDFLKVFIGDLIPQDNAKAL